LPEPSGSRLDGAGLRFGGRASPTSQNLQGLAGGWETTEDCDVNKIWANSGDSHFLEPETLWAEILPEKLAARMPRNERVSESEEIVHVDGRSFRRALPKVQVKKGSDGLTATEASMRPPGARNISARLKDLDDEGIWAEVVYPSLGLWQGMITDPALVKAASRAQNEWYISDIQNVAPDRLVPVGQLPLLDVRDAVDEVYHAAEIGLHAVQVPLTVPHGLPNYNDDVWKPLWAAIEDAGLVLTFHIGTDSGELVMFGGPGGAILNYLETGYSGMRIATVMVSSGVLDRHPALKVLISEGGATWVPYVGDRMNEAYRQHGAFVRPTLSTLPKEILYRQVYTSFQHDVSAPAALTAMAYPNVMWGSDYPHLEGTFGHTQTTLHELFDDVDDSTTRRVTRETFCELFPHVSAPPTGET
jgi:predicted TIM-barrel fold metal-dependent hydrolase